MGGALVSGLLRGGWTPADLTLVEAYGPRAIQLREETGCRTVATPKQGISGQDVVVLAVKPQDIDPALAQLAAVMAGSQILVALVAGVPISVYERSLGKIPVIRTMPNTPALVGEGVTVCSPGTYARRRHVEMACAVLSAVGMVEEVEESLMDAVTAVSGSGPAYAYLLAEAMIAEGVEQGLDQDIARRLAARTIKGAGLMMEVSEDSPSVLRQRVTSPGGTTAAALEVMQQQGLAMIVRAAIASATARSVDLGKIAAEGRQDAP